MNRSETKLLVEEWRNFINNDYSLQSKKNIICENIYTDMSKEQKEAADTLLDFISWVPGIGSITSFAQAVKSYLDNDYFNTVCYLISMYPIKGKFIGKTAQTMRKVLKPYYEEYQKTGKINIEEILENPEDDIVNFLLAIAEFKLKIKPIYRLAGGKNKVKENATSGLERVFDFLEAVSDAKKQKDKESMRLENEPDTLGA
jgi:hypothetical protein